MEDALQEALSEELGEGPTGNHEVSSELADGLSWLRERNPNMADKIEQLIRARGVETDTVPQDACLGEEATLRFDRSHEHLRAATTLDVVGKCSRCHGLLQDQQGVPCRGRRLVDAARLLTMAQLPARYGAPYPGRLGARFTAWLDGFTAGDKGWWFHGRCGCGKTHLGCHILRELSMRGIRCRYYDVAGLLARIRRTYDRRDGESEQDIIDAAVGMPVIFLDDAFKFRSSDRGQFEVRILEHIIDRRYTSGSRSTFVASNQSPSGVKQATGHIDRDGMLSEDVERLVSRLQSMTTARPLKDIDHRAAS